MKADKRDDPTVSMTADPAEASVVGLTQSYMNPFQRADGFAKKIAEPTKDGKTVEFEGAQDPSTIGLVKRKYRIEFDKDFLRKVEHGRSEWDRWLKLVNNTSNKQVW